MRYFRLTKDDSNFRSEGSSQLIWDLPLTLDHTKVGLSSFSISVTSDYTQTEQTVLVPIKCNLLDRTMDNQQGLLHIVPIMVENDYTYFTPSNQIGKYIIT